MKTSIKTFAYALAFVSAFSLTANAEDKENKKSTGFGTGIYATKTGKINVRVDKYGTDAPTMLLLRNEYGEIIYRETVSKKEQKIGRLLNVNDLDPGKYAIEIISKGEKQSKSFELSEQKTERILELK